MDLVNHWNSMDTRGTKVYVRTKCFRFKSSLRIKFSTLKIKCQLKHLRLDEWSRVHGVNDWSSMDYWDTMVKVRVSMRERF